MNIVQSAILGTAGMAAGWFIPLIAHKTALYKMRKNGKTLSEDDRFTANLLKLLCLAVNGVMWAAVGFFTVNPFHASLLAVILLDACVIILVDVRIRLIPNEAVLILLAAGLVLQVLIYGPASLLGGVVTMLLVMAVFLVLGLLLGLNTVGAGDIKLAGAMGLMLGYPNIMYALIGMGALILLWCSGGFLTKRLHLKSMLAFAPFMMAGTIFAIMIHITRY
jgi:Flp pilus assembly protein protease CpaA